MPCKFVKDSTAFSFFNTFLLIGFNIIKNLIRFYRIFNIQMNSLIATNFNLLIPSNLMVYSVQCTLHYNGKKRIVGNIKRHQVAKILGITNLSLRQELRPF